MVQAIMKRHLNILLSPSAWIFEIVEIVETKDIEGNF